MAPHRTGVCEEVVERLSVEIKFSGAVHHKVCLYTYDEIPCKVYPQLGAGAESTGSQHNILSFMPGNYGTNPQSQCTFLFAKGSRPPNCQRRRKIVVGMRIFNLSPPSSPQLSGYRRLNAEANTSRVPPKTTQSTTMSESETIPALQEYAPSNCSDKDHMCHAGRPVVAANSNLSKSYFLTRFHLRSCAKFHSIPSLCQLAFCLMTSGSQCKVSQPRYAMKLSMSRSSCVDDTAPCQT
jgi:hypothetical protein